jgi:peptidoglycan/xylan/chitin deacetylase (PgdA/CDA1 family)
VSRFVRKSLEPILVGIEPVAAYLIRNRVTVFFAHLYPDNGKELDRKKIFNDLLYLREHCQVRSLPDVLGRLEIGEQLPRRAVTIIVDDATQSFNKYGRELLSDAGLPYTLAVIPGLIKSDDKEHLLARLMRIAGHPYWLPHEEMLQHVMDWFGESESGSNTTFEAVFNKAFDLPKGDLLDLIDHVQALDHDFISWDDLRSIQDQDDVNFVSHTMSHPQLRFVTGAWLEWEFRRSKQLIESNLSEKVESLVVPYGHPKHLTPEVIKSLEDLAFKHMFFTEKGVVGPKTLGYRMPRMPLEDASWRVRIHSCPAISSVLYPSTGWRD